MPSSLNVISNKIGNGGPLLEPYPNWSWAENQNCSGITSVYRVAVIKNCFHIGITIDFYNIKDTLYEYIIIWKINIIFLSVDPFLQYNLFILYFLIIRFFVSFSHSRISLLYLFSKFSLIKFLIYVIKIILFYYIQLIYYYYDILFRLTYGIDYGF